MEKQKMNSIQIQRTDEIKSIISEINGMLKMSVSKATKVGELLSQQRNELFDDNNFVSWVNSELNIGIDTVKKYIQLYKYDDKIRLCSNLSTAYAKVSEIEYQEKKSKEKEDNKLIFEYNKTGIKPDGWERKHDYLYKKQLDDSAYEQRKEEAYNKKKEESNHKKEESENRVREAKEKADLFSKLADEMLKEDKEKPNLNLDNNLDNKNQDEIINIIENYIYSNNDISRQLELTNNLIKYLRSISIKLNQNIKEVE